MLMSFVVTGVSVVVVFRMLMRGDVRTILVNNKSSPLSRPGRRGSAARAQ